SIGAFPIFLPVNHYNHCYVIDTLDAWVIELQNINEALVQSMLPISKIEEPVHIVIKELKTKTQILKNVYAFTERTFITKKYVFFEEKEVVAGIIYTDEKGVTKIISWPNSDDDNFKPETFIDHLFSAQKAQEFIDEVEEKARFGLKSFESVKQMFKAKQKQQLPAQVEQSHQKFAKQTQAAKTIQQAYRKKRKENVFDTLVSDVEQKVEKVEAAL
ncbi:hypothetical protein KBB68_02960, partial [Candidatus Babeliales bacterium]|nr:hypothetical protein [Candidatus Babeliales bacterium]